MFIMAFQVTTIHLTVTAYKRDKLCSSILLSPITYDNGKHHTIQKVFCNLYFKAVWFSNVDGLKTLLLGNNSSMTLSWHALLEIL